MTTETNATSFVAYTMVPQVEALLEQHLGERAKVLLPDKHRDTFVRLFPWITLVFMPLHLVAVMLLFGVTLLASVFGHFSFGGALLSAAILACDVIALPGLFKRARKGWEFFVYAQAVGVIGSLLSLSVFGLAVGVCILWLAFQVKYRYA